ncbi:MAG TPA: hypothetical protein VE860_01300, partial [Chthoniobacterales bacterium]|nr:hypothetical protein [Chthoniobacterales bacterium]
MEGELLATKGGRVTLCVTGLTISQTRLASETANPPSDQAAGWGNSKPVHCGGLNFVGSII